MWTCAWIGQYHEAVTEKAQRKAKVEAVQEVESGPSPMRQCDQTLVPGHGHVPLRGLEIDQYLLHGYLTILGTLNLQDEDLLGVLSLFLD
jgi:hypothetical protein